MKYSDIYHLSLSHFYYFVSVADVGSMTAAAEKLHVSQPLLSQKIAQIEAVLGVKVFKRYKNHLYLTEAGKYLADQSIRLLELSSHMYAETHNYAARQEPQRLRIAFSEGQAPSRINNVVDRLQAAFEDTPVETVLLPRTNLVNSLIEEDIDICCISDTEKLAQNKQINYRKLYTVKVICVVSRRSPLYQKEHLTWSDLNGSICFWPMSLKEMQITKSISNYAKENHSKVNFLYLDSDYSTVQKYLHVKNGYTLLLSQEMALDDPNLKAFPLDGLYFPFIAAWKKERTSQLEDYVDKLISIYKAKPVP